MADEIKYKGQPPVESDRYVCQKCMRTKLGKKNFYTYRDGSKFRLCRDCLTMHINNFDPNTFLWILEDADVPWIPSVWNKLRDQAFAKNPNLTGASVIGKYISSMKLKQHKDYRWADTDRLMHEEEERRAALSEEERAAHEAFEEQLRKQFEEGTITEAEYKTYMPTEEQVEDPLLQQLAGDPNAQATAVSLFNESNYVSKADIPDPAEELTKEDKIALAMKWGRQYTVQELLSMELDYKNMMDSFDIQDADTENTLKLLCKANLKANQAIDNGDIDGFNKLSRTSDALRKSAKFSAAANKRGETDEIDCLGMLVRICEEEGGFIPRFCTDIPQDKVDKTLQDMNQYLNDLVTRDLGFGAQIENYIKKIQLQEEEEAERSRLDDLDVEHIYDDEILDIPVSDRDVADFYEEQDNQKAQDAKITPEDDAFSDMRRRIKEMEERKNGSK